MESSSRDEISSVDNKDMYRPGAPQSRPKYRFSVEEMRVLKECNRESFYFRSLPIASLGALAVHYGVRQGYLKGHPKYGSTFKILGVAAFGWFLGKISYRKTCEEKLMKLPNSQFAEMLRKRAGGYTEMLTTEMPGSSDKFYTLPDAKSTPADFDSRRTLSVDKYKQNPGLEDNLRPTMDNSERLQRLESYETTETEARPTSSYEELRKRNREQYELSSQGGRRPGGPMPPSSAGTPPPSFYNPPETARRTTKTQGEAKNQYGDVWEE